MFVQYFALQTMAKPIISVCIMLSKIVPSWLLCNVLYKYYAPILSVQLLYCGYYYVCCYYCYYYYYVMTYLTSVNHYICLELLLYCNSVSRLHYTHPEYFTDVLILCLQMRLKYAYMIYIAINQLKARIPH